MSDKEKIQQLENKIKKLEKENQGLFELYSFKDISLISKVLKDYENTIESQQKEIEELKYKVREHICIEAHEQVKQLYVSKDKIKAKIEEYKEKCKKCNFRGKICDEFIKNYECTIGVCLKEFYSLLEKE